MVIVNRESKTSTSLHLYAGRRKKRSDVKFPMFQRVTPYEFNRIVNVIVCLGKPAGKVHELAIWTCESGYREKAKRIGNRYGKHDMALNVIGQNWSCKPECNGGLGLVLSSLSSASTRQYKPLVTNVTDRCSNFPHHNGLNIPYLVRLRCYGCSNDSGGTVHTQRASASVSLGTSETFKKLIGIQDHSNCAYAGPGVLLSYVDGHLSGSTTSTNL